MIRLSLSQRIFLITAVALLPTIIIIVLNIWIIRAERQAEMHDQASRAARAAAVELERIVNGVEAVLATVAIAQVEAFANPADCAGFLRRIVDGLPHLQSVALIGDDGRVLCASNPADIGTDARNQPWFDAARRHGGRVVGTYTENPATGAPGLPIAMSGAVSPNPPGAVAVAVGVIDLAWLGARMRERSVPPGGALTLADRDGRILTREPFPERFVGTVIPAAFQHLVNAPGPGTLELVSQDGVRRIIGYLPAGHDPVVGLYISAGLSTDAGLAVIRHVTLRAVLVAVAGIAVAMLLAWLTSDAFIRQPVRRMLATIDAWQRNDNAARTGLGPDLAELGRVGAALDSFMDRLTVARAERRTAEAQRELLARELDHRVKNLLASVQAVARQTFRGSSDEAARIFSGRLAAMGNAHQVLMSGAWRAAPMHDLVAAAVAPFNHATAAEGAPFAMSGPAFDVDSHAAMALSMGLHELCTNAAKHGALSRPGGKVALSWRLDGDGFTLV